MFKPVNRLFAYLCVLALLLAGSAKAFSQTKLMQFDGKSWLQHVKVLADDNMEGRGTGTPGLERAAAYIVNQLKKSGLQPAGTKGFYQPIPFRTRVLDESQSSLSVITNGHEQKLTIGDEATFSTRVDLAPEIDADLVFVGYGERIPELKIDDFEGLDVKGKVLVVFSGSRSNVPGPLSAHYHSAGERAKLMRELGVIGAIIIGNPAAAELPWSRIASSRAIASMAIDDESLNESKGVGLSMSWNPDKAEMLFDGTGHTFKEIAELGKDRKPLPHFDLNKKLKAKTKLIQTKVESANVVAKLPGSDPKLKDEYLVLSAHMDHLGIGPAIDGDKVYNGAMDNASGVSALLDIAASLKGAKLKRSVLFVFVTAEEKGLLGSRYFATHPTVPANSIVADINTDMFLPIFPMKFLTVYGLNESTLGDTVTTIAKQDNIGTMDDPEPLQNHFIRSDQYNFIKRGIPSIALKNGYEKGTLEEAKIKEWSTSRYHAPSDDLQQPISTSAAATLETIVRGVVLEVANAGTRPEWKPDSFFRRYSQEENAGK